jgi:outer membrane lipoprotein-sorting protein
MEIMRIIAASLLLAITTAVVASSSAGAQQSAAETPQNVLAAQVRIQGYTCDKALGATRDKKRSRPDLAAWILRCSNATYRVIRAPDMAAAIKPLQSATVQPLQ